jgi:steroid delta-isomerase-like uncharacterized protein
MDETERLIQAYYEAFNQGDKPGFLGLLAPDVVHDISQGGHEVGRDAFAHFWDQMARCYRERITDLVVMTDATGARAAAEFTVHGTYLHTDPGVPSGTAPARGQSYVLPAGAFFSVHEGKITRISNHYNLAEWVRQVA